MQKFNTLKSIPAYLPIVNIDTDMIIPKQFLKTIKRTGLGKNLFFEMRYDDQGKEIGDFILNQNPFNNSKILIAGKNFGCGSSREHAPWALLDFGITCVISSSFADIFYSNCFKNGILPIVLEEEKIKELSEYANRKEEISIDLNENKIVYGNNEIKFDEVKNARYQVVIKNLRDIRDTQLAHRTVKGVFQDNWDSLVKFVEIDSFTITQRRDSSILDKEMTKRYGGVKTYKDIVIVDTLGLVSVKDSLFGFDDRYLRMMNVPFSKNDQTKFELNAGFLNQNGIDIPVFESFVRKRVILHDQSLNLVLKENQVQSVDGVNGPTLKIGSMNEVNTNGNWPKNYSKDN